MSSRGGCLPGMGGCLPGGVVCPRGVQPPPADRILENITFLQLRLRTIIIQENGLTTFAYQVSTVFDIVSGSWSVNLNIPV